MLLLLLLTKQRWSGMSTTERGCPACTAGSTLCRCLGWCLQLQHQQQLLPPTALQLPQPAAAVPATAVGRMLVQGSSSQQWQLCPLPRQRQALGTTCSCSAALLVLLGRSWIRLCRVMSLGTIRSWEQMVQLLRVARVKRPPAWRGCRPWQLAQLRQGACRHLQLQLVGSMLLLACMVGTLQQRRRRSWVLPAWGVHSRAAWLACSSTLLLPMRCLQRFRHQCRAVWQLCMVAITGTTITTTTAAPTSTTARTLRRQ